MVGVDVGWSLTNKSAQSGGNYRKNCTAQHHAEESDKLDSLARPISDWIVPWFFVIAQNITMILPNMNKSFADCLACAGHRSRGPRAVAPRSDRKS